MIGNLSILLCSFVSICIICFYLFKVWPDFNVVDLYIVFILFHFGFYPFVRGLHFGKDVIFDFRIANPAAIITLFLHLLLILAVSIVIYLNLPKAITECLKLNSLIVKWTQINKYILFFIYGTLIIFQIFSYYKYGIKTYILPDDFARIGKDLPYWFTTIRTIYTPLAFLVCLGLISASLKSKGYQKYIWLILTLGFLPVVVLYGRRFLVAVIIVWAILWLVEYRKNVFSIKNLAVGLSLVLIFLLFSNIYQAYRIEAQMVGQVNPEKLKNPFAAAINFEATLKNFQVRPGTWEFNFLVFDRQISQASMTTKGKITWEGFKSSVPRIFWSDKNFLGIDEIIAGLYRVNPKEIDIGKNLFGVGQVEIGYFSLIIVPLIIITIIVLMSVLIKMSEHYPTFLWLFTGNILYFMVNIEENGNEIFFMLRNIGLVFVAFCVYLLVEKIIKLYTPKFSKVFASILFASIQR